MSDWSALDAAANAIMQETFGEPVVYQSAQAGMAVGDPVTITAVRHARMLESPARWPTSKRSRSIRRTFRTTLKRRLGHRLGLAVRGDGSAPAGSLRHGQLH